MSNLNPGKVADIVRDAGGRIVGRTRLQKIAFLLSAAGLEDGFNFGYKHYGPFSDEVAASARAADLLGLLSETEHQATWGGSYSVYSANGSSCSEFSESRRELASKVASADAIELELAATALFFALEGHHAPWEETARRKPDKAANGRLDRARALYRQISLCKTPRAWPQILHT